MEQTAVVLESREGRGGWRPSRRRALGWAQEEAAALSLMVLRTPGPHNWSLDTFGLTDTLVGPHTP